MIDLVNCLQEIEKLLPIVPQLIGHIPELHAAAELASAVGANPAKLHDAHQLLTLAHRQLLEVVTTATPIVSAAAFDLVAIGQEFLVDAGKLLPRLLSPIPGDAAIAFAQLLALPGIAIAKAGERLTQLAKELEPATTRANDVALAPIPELPAEIPPAAPAPTPAMSTVSLSTSESGSTAAGEAAVAAAKSQIGVPYVWGGTTPGAGFDCSGLTQWAWRQAGIELPRLAQEQTVGRPVAYEDLQAGDLLVWDGHVAMYDGAGSIVEAGDPISVNPIRTTNMGMAFKGYYRPTG
ncbi:C40 family peptidase [Corynebacterium epidermidicanis]|uniref:Cell wall-associated hydrolase, invasion-associated protein n=1 Tax=Corynebacterium epidermidicanis TaxID=1050174 RepID=A0A0G3GMS5_9CORY|nr:C40 family peptidase [Corynebacterium epidermidicanis]AKK02439.1 cell wall-associated hydrolase, invasion-associated protein [Corynebacterium epidermidicanis]